MKQRIITFLICSAAAVAVMAHIHMSSTHYASGQNIVIAYDGLPAGAEVNFLTWSDSGKKSAFIEYKTDSLRVRGFVPAEALSAAKR